MHAQRSKRRYSNQTRLVDIATVGLVELDEDHDVSLACSEPDEKAGVAGDPKAETGVPESRLYSWSCHSAVGIAGTAASWLDTISRDNRDCLLARRSSYEAGC